MSVLLLVFLLLLLLSVNLLSAVLSELRKNSAWVFRVLSALEQEDYALNSDLISQRVGLLVQRAHL